MVNFDEVVVMREEFLEKLNKSIDKVIQQKQSMNLDYDLIEKALETMLKNVNSVEMNKVGSIVPMKKEEMLKETLDFFKSIDSELYKKAIDTILQQTNNIKMNIYNINEVKDFNKEDELGLLIYSPNANVERRNGFARVHIPIRNQLDSQKENSVKKVECTLEDLYIIVHEIGHLFDLDLDSSRPDSEELAGGREYQPIEITRELLGEATAMAFEGMLSDYLLENGKYSKAEIQQISKFNLNGFLQDARMVYGKLLLANEKTKNGKISLEFIEKFMRDNGFSIQYVRRMALSIINDPISVLYQKRYALGGLIAPTIIKKYKEEGVTTLKKYLQEAKSGSFESALNALGIELNEKGLKQLVVNVKEYAANINMKIK